MTAHRHPRALIVPASALLALVAVTRIAAGQAMPMSMPMPMPMNHEAMTRVPQHGLIRPNPVITAAADTVFAGNFIFDADGNLNTQVDTVFIEPGSSVLWILTAGFHTITNGTGSTDPQMGALFDEAINSTTPQVSLTFPTPDTIPYFCTFHEDFNMRGVIVVRSLIGVPDAGGNGGRFLGEPVPNPTRGEVRFGLRLPLAGRVRADVFDLAGRLVAHVVDEERAPGDQSIVWNASRSLRPGTYYLRVQAPGFDGKQAVTILR
jgi:plastocyanin